MKALNILEENIHYLCASRLSYKTVNEAISELKSLEQQNTAQNEIDYAKSKNKPIRYIEPLKC